MKHAISTFFTKFMSFTPSDKKKGWGLKTFTSPIKIYIWMGQNAGLGYKNTHNISALLYISFLSAQWC